MLTLGGLRTEQIQPRKNKALVSIKDRSILSHREFSVIRMGYNASDDWEVAEVEALGEGDWEPVEVGDLVIIRAGWLQGSGGKAGSDISRVMGERRESHVIVTIDEIVAKVG